MILGKASTICVGASIDFLISKYKNLELFFNIGKNG